MLISDVQSRRRGSRILKDVLICLLSFFSASAAFALDFTTHQNTSAKLNAVMASGEVVNGDVEALERLLRSLPKKATTAVYLASPGGSLYEGMRLGLYFKDHGIKTIVEGGADCASACALAFLGGADNAGNPWRSSSSNSRLGFHAFSAHDHINANEVQAVVADILYYATAVEAPLYIITKLFETPSHEVYWLDSTEVCSLGIKLWSNEGARFLC